MQNYKNTMSKRENMDDNDTTDEGGTKPETLGLASSRPKRERNPRANKAGRFSALEALKVCSIHKGVAQSII